MNKESADSFAFSDEDSNYKGSRYSEVRDAIFANPYQRTWGASGNPPLPIYPVTLGGILGGSLSLAKTSLFYLAVERTLDARTDLRWGPDGKGQRRLIHKNSVCLTGLWEITEQNPYSGYFKPGSRGLTIGRYSTCCTETRRGHARSLALVCKIYPTTDPNHPEPLIPGNFFAQQDLGGDFTDYINDAELRNAPDTRSWRRGLGLPVLLLEGLQFLRADKQPSIRQVYQIAELGKPLDEPTNAPEFLRLRVAPEQPRIPGESLDFRDEIMAQIHDPGDPVPKRSLCFIVEVSDTGITKGLAGYQRREITDWRMIGKLTFKEAVVSHNGDFVLQFNHPTWRSDRNDPATATRSGGRKVG